MSPLEFYRIVSRIAKEAALWADTAILEYPAPVHPSVAGRFVADIEGSLRRIKDGVAGAAEPQPAVALTNAQFTQQAAYLAKNCASWAADNLTLREEINEPMHKEALQRFCAFVRRRLDSIEHQAGLREVWNHKQRRTWHTIQGTASAQCATGPIHEGDEVYIYAGTHDDSGKLWVRKVSEFHDGRFEKVEP